MQATDDDIPTQRTACMRYIESRPDWIFEKEYLEIGISGYKNKISDRDKLREIKNDIIGGSIEILLVFMFDRLGRQNELQLLVKFFTEKGCEVWSVREGQMKFEEHIDDLLSFITFWQAAGESRKTSIRVSEAMTQMAQAGKHTGGRPPYGYIAVPTGSITKKGLPEKALAINEGEAAVVRAVYNLAAAKGYGCHKIAKHLNRHGMFTKSGKQWGHAAISNILKNPIYKGVRAYNRTTAKTPGRKQHRVSQENWTLFPPNPALAIVPEEVWALVQKNQTAREKKPVRAKLLFAGYAYCGYCGAKMSVGYHSQGKPVYKCTAKASGKLGCESKSSYSPEKIEAIVLEEAGSRRELIERVTIYRERVEVRLLSPQTVTLETR